ncbi:MAG: hypothetical protein XD78_1180 [Desulfotomaculum sp. 46_296]|nr:MAG: hypothetical protein XD78_1180 [Desulfotomaculum sp. 46_296]HAU30747.1 hypothetical protein [Desulfotomaculum sp.]
MNSQSEINNLLLAPVLLMMCIKPDTEEKLGCMSSLIEAVFATIQTFRSGLENFQTSMTKAFPGSDDNQQTPEA